MSNKVIKDSIRNSKSLTRCSFIAELNFPRFILLTDDWGCFEIDLETIRGYLYPKRLKKVTTSKITNWLKEYKDNGMLFCWYEGEKEFGYFVNYNNHSGEYLSRRHKRKTPEPPEKEVIEYQKSCDPNIIKRRERERKYYQTPKGKEIIGRKDAKRRKLGFNLLNDNFPNSVGHHINDNDVVYILEDIHLYCYAGHDVDKHRKLVLEFYGSLDNMVNNIILDENFKTIQKTSKDFKSSPNLNPNLNLNPKPIYIVILDFWNSQEKLPTHTTKGKIWDNIKEAINGRLTEEATEESIIDTIKNYVKIINGKEYYFNYRWTLPDFLQRGFEKFKDWEIADYNYRKEDQPEIEEKEHKKEWVKIKDSEGKIIKRVKI